MHTPARWSVTRRAPGHRSACGARPTPRAVEPRPRAGRVPHAGGTRGDSQICNPGAAHLALTVDDIHPRYDALSSPIVRFYSPPNTITACANEGGFTCYFEAPIRSREQAERLLDLTLDGLSADPRRT